MNINSKDIKVFTGNSNREMAEQIALNLGLSLGKSDVLTFSDGEISASIHESVRGSDVFIIQSTSHPVNDNIMELLIIIDALKRASSGRITAVIPYFGYARQDRKTKARDPISAKLVADIITTAGADRILTMDLHASQIQGFFNIPVDHLLGVPILAPYFYDKFKDQKDEVVVVSPDLGSVTRARNFATKINVVDHLLGVPILAPYFYDKFKDQKDEVVVVSPDLGSVTRARNFATKINVPLAIVDKRRQKANVSEVMNIIGNVRDKKVILVDDMIDTAGTLCNAANAIVEKGGAKEVYACATHGVLSGPAIERIKNSVIKELIILDTINIPKEKRINKLVLLPCAPIFAEAIGRIYGDKSISPLFK